MRIIVFGAAGNVGRRVIAEALLDEAEQPQHHWKRFTVAY